jgi:hypothetical protein
MGKEYLRRKERHGAMNEIKERMKGMKSKDAK